ncbi:MAG TPA: PhoPQ-activated protein PqaA family protein [Gammaproteobacteria bacterium]
MRTLASLLAVCLAAAAHAAPDSPPDEALADYVAAPDPSYAWHVKQRYEHAGAAIVELRLHSQTWRGTLWKHRLFVIRPDNLDPGARHAVMVIGGGRWRPEYDGTAPGKLPDGAALFVQIANRLRSIVAVIAQVPYQPLFDLGEDELIAYTFEQYIATGDAEWPLLLPMVKSVTRAMDATQAFAEQEWDAAVEAFTVLGGSKRGWTTWLTGAVEPRAAALMPIVIDVLNFGAHMPYQTAVWGAPSPEIAPYTRRGLPELLGSEEGEALREIVDPYSYRDRFEQPKVIVAATNDPYFPLDAMNLYWDELPEPKYALYLPNEVHDVQDYTRVLATLGALHRHAEGVEPLPELEWEFEERDGALRLCLRAEPAPAVVAVWTADSADAGFTAAEFRRVRMGREGDAYVHDLPWPADGYRAMFAEALFGEGDEVYTLSTNVRIADPQGRAPSPATAIEGTAGVCP